MGYRVEYSPVVKASGVEKGVSRKVHLTVLCLLLFCMLVGILWPEGAEALRWLVFPGNLAVTTAALDDLTADLKMGVPFQDALQCFCLSIMEAAENVAVS